MGGGNGDGDEILPLQNPKIKQLTIFKIGNLKILRWNHHK